MKERAWAAIQQMLPSLMGNGIPIPPEVLDYAPIPSSLAAQWKQILEPLFQQYLAQTQLSLMSLAAQGMGGMGGMGGGPGAGTAMGGAGNMEKGVGISTPVSTAPTDQDMQNRMINQT